MKLYITLLLQLLVVALLVAIAASFAPIGRTTRWPSRALRAAPSSSDFEQPIAAADGGVVDPNTYNVPLEKTADLWTVSVQSQRSADREVGVPYLASKSKDYFVDDVRLVISRAGGMGMELLELAGGRDDDFGLTIVSGVSGNAASAGVLAGDSIASVQVVSTSSSAAAVEDGFNVQETQESFGCECRNFDTTIGLLSSFPPQVASLVLNLKRIRRWPKIQVVVEYPPSQCAPGADNKERVELFAGENLRRALLNRGIVMQDGQANKCDFCGGKCTVKIDMGMPLTNPMSTTEAKIMKNNPKCRLSCKTLVGHNMQEGNMRLKVNLNEWAAGDREASSPFFSR